MTHPIVAAKKALVSTLKDAIRSTDYDDKVDVFNRKSPQYASFIAVCLGSAAAEIERATMSQTRARFEESWSVEAFIYPSPSSSSTVAFDRDEEELVVGDLMDLFQSHLAEEYRLGGVDSLYRCQITNLEILDQEESDGVYGRMIFALDFRKTR